MRLFYHLDRARYIKPGDILTLEEEPGDIFLGVWTPFVDAAFVEHLRGLARSGLSRHGTLYLIAMIAEQCPLSNYMTEMYWEHVRWKEYPDKPSRFRSVFAWDNIEQTIKFANDAGSGVLFEIESDQGYHRADMNLLHMDFDPAVQLNRARRYWESKPAETSLAYKPQWEYLVIPPARVIRDVPLR